MEWVYSYNSRAHTELANRQLPGLTDNKILLKTNMLSPSFVTKVTNYADWNKCIFIG